MKKKDELTYTQIVLMALLTELALIVIQFAYMRLSSQPGAETGFTSAYMKAKGFYIFQILGFFIYMVAAFILSGKLSEKIINKVVIFVIVAGVIELSFYLLIQAEYVGGFLYSIFSKFIGAGFGLILSLIKGTTKEKSWF